MYSEDILVERIGLLADAVNDDCYGKKFVLRNDIGAGSIRKIDLGPLLHIIMSDYELKNDTILKRPKVESALAEENYITFGFRNIRNLPTVIVSSADMDLEIFSPANTCTNNIIVTIHSSLLKDLFFRNELNNLWDSILAGNRPFLYEEIISKEIQLVAIALNEARPSAGLAAFYYRVKAEELIFLFFELFSKRSNIPAYPINGGDVKIIYQIRDRVAGDLSLGPDLYQLSELFFMSESKMQRLFKQVFGYTIYNYHQSLRIKEAARLIKDEKISISEAGYRLNYTNLSYFSRVFRKYWGVNPKQYSMLNK